MTLLLLLAACGFQLRGDPQVGFLKLFITSVGASAVVADMKRALLAGTTRIVATPAEAEAQLRVLQEEREKSVSTITASGRVYEYQLTLSVRYRMTIPGREEPVIAPTETVARRLITYSEAAPIAKEAEEQLLFKDMQLELADKILRQVAVARRDM